MSPMILDSPLTAPRERSENRSPMAKATLRKTENPGRSINGRAIQIAMGLLGWSLKDLSRETGRDERQLSRWINGDERAQFDTLFDVAVLHEALIIGLAKASGAAEVTTTIKLRREA